MRSLEIFEEQKDCGGCLGVFVSVKIVTKSRLRATVEKTGHEEMFLTRRLPPMTSESVDCLLRLILLLDSQRAQVARWAVSVFRPPEYCASNGTFHRCLPPRPAFGTELGRWPQTQPAPKF